MPRIFREQDAKQGRAGSRVLVVLVCAIALALAVWVLAEWMAPGQETPQAPTEPPAGQTEALPPAPQ